MYQTNVLGEVVMVEGLKIQAHSVAVNQVCKCTPTLSITKHKKISLIERLMYRLESHESIGEMLICYGICLLSLLYLVGSLIRLAF